MHHSVPPTFVLFLLSSLQLFAVSATIEHSGRRVVGVPDTEHKPLGQNIQILEQNACNAKVIARNVLDVPDDCRFVHGLYRYIYLPKGTSTRHQVLIDFSLYRSGKSSHTFMVNEPLVVDEISTPFLP